MGRGIGKVQETILEELQKGKVEHLTVADVAMRIFKTSKAELTTSQTKTVMRALRSLETRGLVETSPQTRVGRSCWMRTGKDLGPAPAPVGISPRVI